MRRRLGADSPGACGLGKAPLPGTGSVLQPCGPRKPEIIGHVTERGGGRSSCSHGLTGICRPRGATLSSYPSLFEPSSCLSSFRTMPSFCGSGQSLGSILDSFSRSHHQPVSKISRLYHENRFRFQSLLSTPTATRWSKTPVSLHKLTNWSPCFYPFCICASPHKQSLDTVAEGTPLNEVRSCYFYSPHFSQSRSQVLTMA